MLNALMILAVVEEAHEEINRALSWGIGAVTLAILLGMVLALVAIGGGREHS